MTRLDSSGALRWECTRGVRSVCRSGGVAMRTWLVWGTGPDASGFGIRWSQDDGVADVVTAQHPHSDGSQLVNVDAVAVVAWRSWRDAVLSLPEVLDAWLTWREGHPGQVVMGPRRG